MKTKCNPKGAGRKPGEPTKQMRVPVSMIKAVEALKRIARGEHRDEDLAEIAISVNTDKLADARGGIVFDPHQFVREIELNAMRENDFYRRSEREDTAIKFRARMKALGI